MPNKSRVATISPKEISSRITLSDEKTYDGTRNADVAFQSLTGVLPGDSLSIAWTEARFTDKHAGVKTLDKDTIWTMLAGPDSGNYTIPASNVTVTNLLNNTAMTIVPRHVLGTFTVTDRGYDGTKSAAVATTRLRDNGEFPDESYSFTGEDARLVVGGAEFSSADAGKWSVKATGTHSLSGADAKNYILDGVDDTGLQGTIGKVSQTITWGNPSSITYGTKLSGTQLNATVSGVSGGSAPGALSYNQAVGDLLNAGSRTLTVTAAATGNYLETTKSVTLQVDKAGQTITWGNPSNITYGTKLSGTQLNATVSGVSGGSAPGALTYSPASDALLNAGSRTLTVTAAGTDNYLEATKSVALQVDKASLTVAVDSVSREYSKSNPSIGHTLTGAQNGDQFAVTTSALVSAGGAAVTSATGAGSYITTAAVSATGGSSLDNYNLTVVDGVFRVTALQALAAYTGDVFAGSATDTGVVTFKAQLSGGGDYTTAAVSFINALTNEVLATGTPDAGGLVSVSWTSPSIGEGLSYLVRAQLGGSNYANTAQLFPSGATWTASNASAYSQVGVFTTYGTDGWLQGAGRFSDGSATGALKDAVAPVGYAVASPPQMAGSGATTGLLDILVPRAAGLYLYRAGTFADLADATDERVLTASGTLFKVGVNGDGTANSVTTSATGVTAVATVPKSLDAVKLELSKGSTVYWSDPSRVPILTGSEGRGGRNRLNKAEQVITWDTPARITYGEALSGTQLNASVAGTPGGAAPGALSYSPASGTVLGAGTRTLTVTAAETAAYLRATKSVSLVVDKAALTVTVASASKSYGQANPVISYTVTGARNGEQFEVTTGAFLSVGGSAVVANTAAGTYVTTATVRALNGASLDNYDLTIVNGTFTIDRLAMTASYTGDIFVTSDTSDATVLLKAQLAGGGDYTTASVSFYNATTNELMGTGTPDASGLVTVSYGVPSVGEGQSYLVRTVVGGANYTNAAQAYPTGSWTASNVAAYGLVGVFSTYGTAGWFQGAGVWTNAAATGTLKDVIAPVSYAIAAPGAMASGSPTTGMVTLLFPRAAGLYLVKASTFADIADSADNRILSSASATIYKVTVNGTADGNTTASVLTGASLVATFPKTLDKVQLSIFKGSTTYWNDNGLISLLNDSTGRNGKNRINP